MLIKADGARAVSYSAFTLSSTSLAILAFSLRLRLAVIERSVSDTGTKPCSIGRIDSFRSNLARTMIELERHLFGPVEHTDYSS